MDLLALRSLDELESYGLINWSKNLKRGHIITSVLELSLIMKKNTEDPHVTYIRDGRAPIPLRESTSRVMSANRGKNTKPEIVFRKYIYSLGVRGYRIHKKDIPGSPDIAFTRKKIAIFINGCFWHRCPFCDPSFPKTNVDFWREKFQKNIERDERQQKELEKKGWKVFVFWECQINQDVNSFTKIFLNYYNLFV